MDVLKQKLGAKAVNGDKICGGIVAPGLKIPAVVQKNVKKGEQIGNGGPRLMEGDLKKGQHINIDQIAAPIISLQQEDQKTVQPIVSVKDIKTGHKAGDGLKTINQKWDSFKGNHDEKVIELAAIYNLCNRESIESPYQVDDDHYGWIVDSPDSSDDEDDQKIRELYRYCLLYTSPSPRDS